MGIKDLNAFLKARAPNAIKQITLSDIKKLVNPDDLKKPLRVSIDTSIYFYKFLYKNPRFIEGFFQQITRLMRNNIIPIYVFDGKPPVEKTDVLVVRKEKKQEYKTRIADLEEKMLNPEETDDNKVNFKIEMDKLKKKLIFVTKEHNETLKYFLDMMNIKYIQADCEADVICSKLCENKVVDMVLSDDMDLLVSGSKILLRDFFVTTNKISVYIVSEILESLDITYDQWIDFCILCGCDYQGRIPGVGSKGAYKYIKTYGDIENVIQNVCGEGKKHTLPENYDFENARKLFKKCDYYYNEYNDIKVEVEDLFDNQLDNIRKFLIKHCNLSEKQINNRLKFIYKI